MDVTIHKELKNRVSIANVSSCRVLKFESGTCFPYLNVCTCFANACKMELVFPYLNADNLENCVCYIISTHLRVRWILNESLLCYRQTERSTLNLFMVLVLQNKLICVITFWKTVSVIIFYLFMFSCKPLSSYRS